LKQLTADRGLLQASKLEAAFYLSNGTSMARLALQSTSALFLLCIFFWVFGVFEFSGAGVSRALNIVIGRHLRKQKKGAFAQLLGAAQNDFRAAVVVLDCFP
jgi:hypothetical protein